MPAMAGSESNAAAADRKRHSAANNRRPVSLSSAVNEDVDIDRAEAKGIFGAHVLFGEPAAASPEHALVHRGNGAPLTAWSGC
jgi:hypothetical protein